MIDIPFKKLGEGMSYHCKKKLRVGGTKKFRIPGVGGLEIVPIPGESGILGPSAIECIRKKKLGVGGPKIIPIL